MIILDTNIMSEMMMPAPEKLVLDWLNEQESASLYLSTISIGEIGYSIRALPASKRRRLLSDSLEALLAAVFENRILNFD